MPPQLQSLYFSHLHLKQKHADQHTLVQTHPCPTFCLFCRLGNHRLEPAAKKPTKLNHHTDKNIHKFIFMQVREHTYACTDFCYTHLLILGCHPIFYAALIYLQIGTTSLHTIVFFISKILFNEYNR